MEWKSNLRRVQSLRSVPSSCDQPTWTEAGLRDKTTSVSQLVARYQTTVEVKTSIQEMSGNNSEARQNQALKEITPSLPESKEPHQEDLLWRNNEREPSRAKTNLTRSKSLGNLQTSAGSIESLRALFEANGATQMKARRSFRDARFPSTNKAADIKPEMNGGFKEVKKPAETQIPPDAAVNDARDDHVTRKVVNQTQVVRRKTIGGIDFEQLAASQADEKRRSFADFRDSSFIQSREKLGGSVKAMSALYLSKVAPQESTHSHLKPTQDQSSESGKRAKLTKFQPACQETCSACLKTVYPMEKITVNKHIFHKNCFCCKQCKKKLSMYNYAPLYGELYCIFHYQQLFRRKGNYDEGFGHAQHKNRWLLRNTADMESNESEA